MPGKGSGAGRGFTGKPDAFWKKAWRFVAKRRKASERFRMHFSWSRREYLRRNGWNQAVPALYAVQ